MSFSIKLDDAIFTNIAEGVVISNRDALVGEWFFGDNESQTIKNRAGGADLIQVREPIYTKNYVECVGFAVSRAAFDTQIVQSIDSGNTIIAVYENSTSKGVTTAGCGNVCSTWTNSIFGLYDYQGTTRFIYNSIGYSDQAQIPVPASDKWTVIAGTGDSFTPAKLFVWQDGILSSATANEVSKASLAANPFQIVTGNVSALRVAYLAIFHRKLTDGEVQLIYDNLKVTMANRGLEIL